MVSKRWRQSKGQKRMAGRRQVRPRALDSHNAELTGKGLLAASGCARVLAQFRRPEMVHDVLPARQVRRIPEFSGPAIGMTFTLNPETERL
jgi:hypothetical protein